MSKSNKSDSKKKKKHHTVTPEAIPSPTHSSDVDKIDILNDEEIQGFAIREEELIKLRNTLQSKQREDEKLMESKRQRIAVRKPILDVKPTFHQVVVARQAPDIAKLKEVDYSGPCGPKYTDDGVIIDYSLLGRTDDFVEEAVRNGHLEPGSPAVVSARKTFQNIQLESYDRPQSVQQETTKYKFDQNKSLQHWKYHMQERKRMQNYLTQQTNKRIEELAMNRVENIRAKVEVQKMIGHLNPYYTSERAYRDGAELWRQPEVIGDEITGLRETIPKSQQEGFPFYYEQIRKPKIVKDETGINDDEEIIGNKWHQNEYVQRRYKQLEKEIKQYHPYVSDTDGLIINNQKQNETQRNREKKQTEFPSPTHGPQDNGDNNPLSIYPDCIPQIYDGPSIKFNGHHAKWEGSSDEQIDQVGLIVRMNLTSSVGSRDVMNLKIENNGTTSIHYEWNKIPKSSKFDNIKHDSIQRFYFNVGEGVILPGDVAVIPFTFKSPNAGIFHETWRFSTTPVLLNGAQLLLVLKAIATQESRQSVIREKCAKIEARLEKREAEVVCDKMMSDIIRGIRTPQRSPSPIDSHFTEEDFFVEKNPGFYYNYHVVAELKEIYQQLYGELDEDIHHHEWNLSINNLRDQIRSIDDVNQKEELLSSINYIISKGLITKPSTPPTSFCYNSTLSSLQLFLDEMSSCSTWLRSTMKMPILNISDSLTSFYEEDKIKSKKVSKEEKDSKKESKKDSKSTKKEKEQVKSSHPRSPRSKDGSGGERTPNRIIKTPPLNDSTLIQNTFDEESWNQESIHYDDEAINAVLYEKYKEKFQIMTRELLVDTLDRIFGFYEQSGC